MGKNDSLATEMDNFLGNEPSPTENKNALVANKNSLLGNKNSPLRVKIPS